ncbi:MAG: hypothetical protein E7037_02485 [Verrucomicrobia bacterium]|nr:hypothetical protein [Verrucomicrobiota bacterium]
MSNKPTPHPHAELIKAWADGAIIQAETIGGGWTDEPTPHWFPQVKYRIKPEESNEQWKPKEDEKYFYLNVINGEVDVDYNKWCNDEIDNALYRLGNIFPTKEKAEAAIPRVEVALKDALKAEDVSKAEQDAIKAFKAEEKFTQNFHFANKKELIAHAESALKGKNGDKVMSREEADSAMRSAIGICAIIDKNTSLLRENNKLKEELESLIIRCEYLQKAKEQLISQQSEIDGKPLTDGEKALIRAFRNGRLCRQFFGANSIIVEGHDKVPQGVATHREFVAFFMHSPMQNDEVRNALEQIKAEQEAQNEAD